MLTDVMTEETCEHRDEELRFHHQDLEHNLHLAAELGKTLLERNHDLEHKFHQMCSTNQEQLQEIQHLTRQLETLRMMTDQHAKVNEQLNTSAYELEQSKRRLVLEKRSDQIKIQRLMEALHSLQIQVEDLQKEVETLKTKQEPQILEEPQRPARARSDSWTVAPAPRSVKDNEHDEEECTDLLTSVQLLQTQLISERCLREAAEREVEELEQKLCDSQSRLVLLDDYKARLEELEAHVEEMKRQRCSGLEMLPGALFCPPEEETCEIWQAGQKLNRYISEESQCLDLTVETSSHTIERLDAVGGSGVSLLSEVDAQYCALQREYDTLLHRRNSERLHSDKAVQTPPGGFGTQDVIQFPEYKILFREIFSLLQNAKKVQ